MKITEERRGEVLIVRPEGRIDTSTSDEPERSLMGRLDAGLKRLVVDMGGTDYISSAGLRVLLLAAKKLRASGGHLAVAGLNPGVRQIFELAGLFSILAVEADTDRAVARVAGGD